tara:strand:- start:1069 stop:1347 length:279 start_codon:yes stop_codon:yes gene_type:complete
MQKSALKACSGSYDSVDKKFSGTYMNNCVDEKHQDYRVGVWKFWYANGKIKSEGLCKDEILISKKFWNSKGESISCDSLVILGYEKFRMFKY